MKNLDSIQLCSLLKIFQIFAKVYEVIRVKHTYSYYGVQGMLPQNMASSHTEFKLKGFEKMAEAGRSF